MQLTSENYYSQEANREYMSVSGYKDFAGTYGKLPCEFHAMEKLNGNWEDEKTTALLVGSYVDSYFEGSLEQFKKDNKEIFTQKGDLKSDYKQAENIIARIERDKYFMKYMSGQKQVIMTGELFRRKKHGSIVHLRQCIQSTQISGHLFDRWVKAHLIKDLLADHPASLPGLSHDKRLIS